MRGVWGANAERIRLENVIASIVSADECLRRAATRVAQWARTEGDRALLNEIIDARHALERAHSSVVQWHPNRRRDEQEDT